MEKAIQGGFIDASELVRDVEQMYGMSKPSLTFEDSSTPTEHITRDNIPTKMRPNHGLQPKRNQKYKVDFLLLPPPE